MNNIDELLKFIRECVADWSLKSDCLDLLEKHKPMSILYEENPFTCLPVSHCPKCGKFARQFHTGEEDETHYCPWCGQAVKWDA